MRRNVDLGVALRKLGLPDVSLSGYLGPDECRARFRIATPAKLRINAITKP